MNAPGIPPGEGSEREGVGLARAGPTPFALLRARLRDLPPSRRRLLGFCTLTLFLLGVGLFSHWYSQTFRIAAPAPGTDGWDPAWPALPASSINVPILLDLDRVLESLEEAVPLRFGDLENRRVHPSNGRVHYSFAVDRDPFVTELQGDTAHLRAVIYYQGRGWYNPPLLPEVRSSCGTDVPRGQRPRAVVALSSPLELDRDWVLRSRVRLDHLGPLSDGDGDRCRVTFLRMDMTDRIMGAARGALEDRTGQIDARLARVDVRGRLEGFWDVLREPVPLTDDVWLVLDPVAVRHGTVGGVPGSPRTLRAEIGVEAHPRIVVGPRPVLPPLPLPALEEGEVQDGFRLILEGRAEYATASDMITRELSDRTFEVGGNRIRIQGVQVEGIGGGRIAVEVQIQGDVQGRIYLVGTPTYDMESQQITVPDLNFDVATRNMLVGGAAWLVRSGFPEFVRRHARWPLEDAMELAETYARRGLNHRLSPEARLEGELQSVEVLGVMATREALKVRTRAEATLRLVIDYND